MYNTIFPETLASDGFRGFPSYISDLKYPTLSGIGADASTASVFQIKSPIELPQKSFTNIWRCRPSRETFPQKFGAVRLLRKLSYKYFTEFWFREKLFSRKTFSQPLANFPTNISRNGRSGKSLLQINHRIFLPGKPSYKKIQVFQLSRSENYMNFPFLPPGKIFHT